jgi:anti-repressor protein
MREETGNALGLVVKEGRVVVSSRHVARVFGKPHGIVTRSIRDLLDKCTPRFGRSNFALTAFKDSQGRDQEEILMTRDGFTLLVMGYTGREAMGFKEAYIAEFNRMERELQGPCAGEFRIPKSLPEALRLAAKLEEERLELEEQNRRLAPKARAWEASCREGTDLSIQAVAKELSRLGTGPRRLFELLARRKVLYRLDGYWVPMQRYIDSGHFRVKRVTVPLGPDRERSYCRTLVTPLGRDLIARVLTERLAVNSPAGGLQ